MDQVVGVVLVHLQFFEDDAALFGDILFAEDGIKHQVGDNVHRARQVLVENLGGEGDVLLAGEGVEMAADRVDRSKRCLRRTVSRSP